MLPNEITPAATAGRAAIEAARDVLMLIATGEIVTQQEIGEVLERLKFAHRSFDRFEACMTDEVRQKTLYRNRWMEYKFPSKD